MRNTMIAVLVVLILAGFVSADVPRLISYQGRLTDGAGIPLAGVHNITFSLYTDPISGPAIWMETQTVAVSVKGLYNVMLGSIASLSSIDFSQQYWLGIAVDGGAEICRYELGASPYALNIADTVLQTNGYVFTDGTTRGCLAQSGLSLASGQVSLPIRNATAVYGYGDYDVGMYGYSDLWEGVIGYSIGDDGVQGVSTSNTYAGVHGINTSVGTVEGYLAYNGYGLYTSYNAYISQYLQLGGIISHPGAGEGKIYYNSIDKTAYLFDGTVWQDLLGSGGVSLWTAHATDPYIYPNNNSDIWVKDTGEMFAFQVNGTASTGASIYGFHTASGAGERYGVIGSCGSLPAGSGTNYGVKGSATGGTINYAVYGDVGGNDGYGVYGSGGAGKPWGYLGGQDCAVHGEGSVNGTASSGDAVGYFKNTITSSDAAGVYAECANTDFYGYGGYFEGGYTGIYAEVNPTGSNIYYGLHGAVVGGSGTNYGVYGYAAGGSTNWSGYFDGSVYGDDASAGIKAFLIDHPSDPEHKLLRHYSIESPEVLVIYRGKVSLDASGEAEVEMPAYFLDLTDENNVTVTLTAIGRTPFLTSYEWDSQTAVVSIYGEPEREVSYQVSAERDDPVKRLLVKPIEEQKGYGKACPDSKLLIPDAYGYPKEMGTTYHPEKQKTIER